MSNTTATNNVKQRKPGRPVINKVAGYKIKVGLRYATDDGMTTSLAEGKVYPNKKAAKKRVTELKKQGEIRVWGGRTREKLIPNKGTKL